MKHAAFCFGRFQPPNAGHSLLFDTTKAAGDDWYVFTSKSFDAAKNPLPYDVKLYWLYRLHSELVGHLIEDSSIKTFLQAASYIYSLGYTSITFVVGKDDVNMFPILGKYNNLKNSHGYYNFDTIRLIVADSPVGRSTDARNAVKENDINKFMTVTGIISINEATDLFLTVKEYLCETI